MTVTLGSNGLIAVSGTETSLLNMHTGGVPLSTGALRVAFGASPVRRLALLTSARIILTGDLTWDPIIDRLLISSSAPDGSGSVSGVYSNNGAGGTIECRSGSHLTIGTETSGTDHPYYSVGEGFVSAKVGDNASDVGSAALLGLPGSEISLFGVTMSVVAACRFDGARPGGGAANAACILRAKDVTMIVNPDGTIGYFAPRLYTTDYQIDGWRQIGGVFQIQARAAASFLRNIRVERMASGIGVTGNNFGALTDFFEIDGLDGGHNSTLDANMYNGMKLRVKSSSNGSLVKVDLQARGHPGRSFGCAELTQPMRIVVTDEQGNPVVGARVHYEDVVAGRPHEEWTEKNVGLNQSGSLSTSVDYRIQRKESKLTIAGGIADIEPTLADMVYNTRPASGDTLTKKEWALRGISNVLGDDRMRIHVDPYLHLGTDSPVVCQGAGRPRAGIGVVLDPSITERMQATVDAYAGIATNKTTDTHTFTATWNIDMIYDRLKSNKTKSGNEEEPSRAGPLASADGTVLDLGSYNIVVGNGGVLTPGTKFRSIRTTGTITTTGTGRIDIGFQDSTGKSILLRLGAPQTSIIYDTGDVATYVRPGLHALHRISLPPTATLNLTVIRETFYYRKYTVAVADIAELEIVLFRNPSIDAGTVIDGIDITTYPQTLDGLYGNNIGFDRSTTVTIPSNVRLGNFDTSGRKALTRKLVDRMMNTQAGLEAIHAHNDEENRAFDIRQDELMIDERWLDIGRQEVSEPPNPAGSLQNLARFGLFVVRRDDITPYVPSPQGAYFVAIDPRVPSVILSGEQGLNVGRRVITEQPVIDGIRDVMRPQFQEVDDKVGAVSRQIRELPIDELLHVITSVRNVPLATSTPNIYTGAAGSSYSLVGGNLQIDWTQPVPDDVADASLSLEGLVPFTLPIPVDNDLVLQMTVRAQALTGGSRYIDPGFVWEWSLGAGATTDLRRRMGYLQESHVGQVLATPGGLGPATIIEFPVGRPASSIDIATAALGMDPPVRNANEHLRIVITRIEWVRKHTASIDDFKADVSNLDVAVSSRLAAADYTPTAIREELIPDIAHGAPNNMDRVTDTAFAATGTYLTANQMNQVSAVWRVPALRRAQNTRLRASIQLKLRDGTDPRAGNAFPATSRLELWIGKGLDGSSTSGATLALEHDIQANAVSQNAADTVDFTTAQSTDFDSMMLRLSAGDTPQFVRGYLWNLMLEVDGIQYIADVTSRNLDAKVSSITGGGGGATNADVLAIKAKTDKLNFNADDDVKATLDGESVGTDSADITAIKAQTDQIQFSSAGAVKASVDRFAVIPVVARVRNAWTRVGRTALRAMLDGSGRSARVTATSTLKSVALFLVNGIVDNIQASVRFSVGVDSRYQDFGLFKTYVASGTMPTTEAEYDALTKREVDSSGRRIDDLSSSIQNTGFNIIAIEFSAGGGSGGSNSIGI